MDLAPCAPGGSILPEGQDLDGATAAALISIKIRGTRP
jgi:hypothetical protein